jgi:hypothetical protein
MPRRLLSFAALVLATLVLAFRVYEINQPAPPLVLAPRTVHVIYLDSLRHELLTFAEQYGRPVYQYDTTLIVTGSGRIQLTRLRQALFDSRVEYAFTDEGFAIDWRSDPKPRSAHTFAAFGAPHVLPHNAIASAWPDPAAEYARVRREFITPKWPEPAPLRRANRRAPNGVPPHGDAYSIIALGQYP